MTARMYPSTHNGKPCFAVQIGTEVRLFRYSHTAAAYLVQTMKGQSK